MPRLIKASLVSLSLLLFGCASTSHPPIVLEKNFWTKKDQKIGIYVDMQTKPLFYMDGDVRLLDYAINAAATSTLSSYVEKLDDSEFNSVAQDLQTAAQSHGYTAEIISQKIDPSKLKDFKDPDSKDTTYFEEKNFSALKAALGVDYLVFIKVNRVGVARPYKGFIPLADPKAILEASGELIDMSSNQLLWSSPIMESTAANGQWDEPPNYPGLTNSFYVSLAAAKQQIISEIGQQTQQSAKNGE